MVFTFGIGPKHPAQMYHVALYTCPGSNNYLVEDKMLGYSFTPVFGLKATTDNRITNPPPHAGFFPLKNCTNE